ncbi:MAG: hypothetical protein ACKO50_07210 [Cyanobium sp.]
MIIYLETREVFQEHVRRNRIEEEVGERLKAIAGRRVSPAEVRAWRNSFQYVCQFLLDPQIPAGAGGSHRISDPQHLAADRPVALRAVAGRPQRSGDC